MDLVAVSSMAGLPRKDWHCRGVASESGFVSGRIEIVCPFVVVVTVVRFVLVVGIGGKGLSLPLIEVDD